MSSIHRLLSTLLPNGAPNSSSNASGKKKKKKRGAAADGGEKDGGPTPTSKSKSTWENTDEKEELEFKVF